MIKVKEIYLRKVEGTCPLPSSVTRNTFEEAEEVLSWWAKKPPESGYDKTDFEVTFEDGFIYKGTLCLKKDGKSHYLKQYIINELKFNAGFAKLTWINHKQYLAAVQESDIVENMHILNRYFLNKEDK